MRIVALFFACIALCQTQAQEVIPVWDGKVPGSEKWTWSEGEMYSDLWDTRVVYNVAKPTLTAYIPPEGRRNGAAVIICPGGAFHALSIDSEGIDLARKLNEKGIAAFVLKYRLVRSLTSDPVREVSMKTANWNKFHEESASVVPLSIDDGLQAVRLVRQRAESYGIDPQRIGIVGFSAGGAVALGVAYRGKGDSKPDFVAPIYAYVMPEIEKDQPGDDAPPLFIAAATDDDLGLASHSVGIYNQWLARRRPAEMHLYSHGGHGFGMRDLSLPSDTWADRFLEWMQVQGLLQPRSSNVDVRESIRRSRERVERVANDWAWLNRYKEENEKLGPPKSGEQRVVFMGNSITAGWITHRPEFFASRPYINRGISGQTTPQMLIRFKQDVINLKPAAVVILAGINDIAENTGPTTPEAILDNLSGMVSLAKAHGIKVILCSVLPAYDFPWRPGLEPAPKVEHLNTLIKEFAEKNGVYYLDYYSSLVDERKGMKKAYARDEVHPTVEGYKVMEPLVEDAIRKVLKKK